MTPTSLRKMLTSLEAAADCMGSEASIKQLTALLLVAQAGPDGIDSGTIEKRLNTSQAATSRTTKLLGPSLGLIEFFLDQSDGRRRLSRLTKKGRECVESVLQATS